MIETIEDVAQARDVTIAALVDGEMSGVVEEFEPDEFVKKLNEEYEATKHRL